MSESPVLQQLQYLYKNIDYAQQVKGVLKLNDARLCLMSLTHLQKRFTERTKSCDIDYKVLTCIKNCAEALQSTGVFSLAGSTDLLNALDAVELALKILTNYTVDLYDTKIGKYYLPGINGDIIVDAMKRGEIYDNDVVDMAKKYIKKNSTVLDIGSNLGQMSILFSKLVGDNGIVYAFEADDFIFSLLEKNININNCTNVIPICKAVYDTDDETVFYPVPDFKRFATFGSHGIDPNATEGRQIKTMTIDSLNIETPISLMKIDIQGSDLFALRGALNTIKKHKMPIIFEFEACFQNEFKTSLKDYLNFIELIDYKIATVFTVHRNNYLILPK